MAQTLVKDETKEPRDLEQVRKEAEEKAMNSMRDAGAILDQIQSLLNQLRQSTGSETDAPSGKWCWF